MKFIQRQDIDLDQWNERIEMDETTNVFSYGWYLDATAENWGALVSSDKLETVLPVAFTKKLGVQQFYQPIFTREYAIFGTIFKWEDVMPFLMKEMANLDFRTATKLTIPTVETRSHQLLNLQPDFNTNFNSNARRLVKKSAKHFTYHVVNTPQLVINLFNATIAHKINAIGEQELVALMQLMETAQKMGKGELLAARDKNGEHIAAGFFLKDKSTITYLKGASTKEAKKNGAMYGLFNFAFDRYCTNFSVFDFGGSSIENVASFYKKFGATDRNYYHYTLDQSPFWFKTLKRINQLRK